MCTIRLSSGSFDVTTGGATLSDYVRIKTNRVLPEITAAQVTPSAVSDTSSFAAVSTIGVCPNSTVTLEQTAQLPFLQQLQSTNGQLLI